ncbi:MAG: hypothetical protein INR71_15700 [Terriglobus roseus]|nr:hypothetical protein [Terriglobus roseus]
MTEVRTFMPRAALGKTAGHALLGLTYCDHNPNRPTMRLEEVGKGAKGDRIGLGIAVKRVSKALLAIKVFGKNVFASLLALAFLAACPSSLPSPLFRRQQVAVVAAERVWEVGGALVEYVPQLDDARTEAGGYPASRKVETFPHEYEQDERAIG